MHSKLFRSNISRLIAIPIILLLFHVSSAFAQGSIFGTVTNSDLTVPAKARSGQKLRLKGRGLPGHPSGDQYAVLQIVVPEAATREAKEFYRRMEQAMPMNPRTRLGV